MNEGIHVDPFEVKTGEVLIRFEYLRLSFLQQVAPAPQPGEPVCVYHRLSTADHPSSGKECKGELVVVFRNRGKDAGSCLALTGILAASSQADTDGHLLVNVGRYLFEWTEKYIQERNITDATGEPFQLPGFAALQPLLVLIPV